MKILLTGAIGFTGQHFIEIATAEGHEVVSLQSDLRHPDKLKAEVEKIQPESVVHLAGISFVGHAESNAFYDINLIGTLNLLDALLPIANSIKRILLVSSANIYGNCEQSPISENQPPSPVSHYAMSKLAMEYMTRTYLDRLPLFYVRPFNYIGPGQSDSFIIPKLINHYVRHADYVELGNIDVEREFNDVRFVCQIYLQLLSKSVVGDIYNVCSGRPVALKAVLQLMNQIARFDLKVKINPAYVRVNDIQSLCGDPGKLLGVTGEISFPALQNTLRWIYQAALPT